ncbi:cytosine/purines/uracil/thiamine/allantoin permease family protein [Burkholderia pseudomallei]|uniref:purine-cytosine permease family protein n=1 Tax=Burkholderia pseudomallei TaxID=28450 RepID=UPI000975DE96|nr:cytosine permease [Burkholderia pseudomallei]AYX40060.1 cytosine permease [Burkholderia pseudomallei]OND93215.1 sulfonate ABC transporter substrate-binding protein [Burkholderia pseudomallei]ONE14466.1 sulfonate ABC transporter substrate-binding protein [Burkholderia pseudomallei]CAJ3592600.1 cytosine/purines/uracil/thiamine/allantoin permease family protein [Burkholderia pseudomallei]CAJ3987863.1 cytosine/purines/uracil/thiamine/allantoin permease family protein [Burkholderia pseudomallei]
MPNVTDAQRRALRERRTIDYIPDHERHGKLSSQFTLWLGANLQVTAIVTGALAVVLGGDVSWSLVGLALGQLLGAAVMALHGAQGPQLGLPQMISSRVQFGIYGAVIPLVLVCLMYVGFSASGTVLAGQALAQLFGVADPVGIFAFIAVVVVLAVFGYRTIHALGRVSSIVGVVAFVYMFVRLLAGHDVGALLAIRHFSLSSFLLAISLSASWQIAYGPYVADYSRYLPRSTSARRTFWAIGLGSVLGAQASMAFGVFAAALAGKQFAGHEVQFIVSLGASGATAALLYFAIAFGKLTITTLNAYGSVMSVATIVTGFSGRAQITQRARMAYVLAMVAAVAWLALVGRHAFLKDFSAFILFLLAFFTPWSAINLVDFYWVTRERYDVPALYDPDGRYGRWNVAGVSIYAIGVLVQMPFIATEFYTGPLVAKLGGTDISWIIGLVVPGVLYYVTARRQTAHVPERLILPDEPSLP